MGSAGAARAPDEVPEWRREVTERLESYRSRRERQARQSGNNQSILEFRLPSKSESGQGLAESMAAAPAAIEAPASEVTAESPVHGESHAGPSEVHAAMAATAAAETHPGNGTASPRTYQPIEETEATADLTAELSSLVSEVPENEDAAPEATAGLEAASAAEAVGPPAALPIASEPAVVLADSATLEVHGDPMELADVQTPEPAIPEQMWAAEPPASVPPIDTEYWRNLPAEEAEETECGSLTSGFESPAPTHEEITPPAEETVSHAEEAAGEEIHASEENLPEEAEELTSVAEARSVDVEAEAPGVSAGEDEPAPVLSAEAAAEEESLFPAALTVGEEDGADDRRAALRTAARPQPGNAPERIEIRVPQPVFDFSPAAMENQQPQDAALPVADLRERRCAAMLDAALLGFTMAGFFLAFHLAGGEFSLSRVGIGVGVVATFLIYAQYVLLFTFVGGATPGMVLRGLRVVSFDGRQPGTIELAWRSFGYLLSAAAGMLGFLWSAWDEHGLSWHDRISQTYITYGDPEAVPAVVSMQ